MKSSPLEQIEIQFASNFYFHFDCNFDYYSIFAVQNQEHMILSDKKISKAIKNGEIVIEPFRRKCLGTNSYDVHLGKWLATYNDMVIDAKSHNKAVSYTHLTLPTNREV